MPGRKFERILVAIADPAAPSKAVRRAGALAHKTGASVDLVNAIPSVVSAGIAHVESERFTRFEAQENHRLLERTANRLRREEIIVNTHAETGYPPPTPPTREESTFSLPTCSGFSPSMPCNCANY